MIYNDPSLLKRRSSKIIITIEVNDYARYTIKVNGVQYKQPTVLEEDKGVLVYCSCSAGEIYLNGTSVGTSNYEYQATRNTTISSVRNGRSYDILINET